jgi:ABC-type multidrug transport system fused ATPase/permease subunit
MNEQALVDMDEMFRLQNIAPAVQTSPTALPLWTPPRCANDVRKQENLPSIDSPSIDSNPSTTSGLVDVAVNPVWSSAPAIEFNNVCFGYTPARPILRDLSFAIPSGETVGVVGPSGCGKSTIIRLLFRFYDPHSGTIKVHGQDIKDVSLER